MARGIRGHDTSGTQMTERNFLPFVFDLPDPSYVRDQAVRQWMLQLNTSVQHALQLISARVDGLLLVGTAAEQPAANGSYRFYWVTDGTPHLEFDDGAWRTV